MAEPAYSAQPHTEQDAVQANGGGAQAAHWPCLDAHPSPDDKDAPRIGSGHEGEQNLHTEVTQLRRAMQTRPTIDQACGMLMATFGLSPQAAWSVLVATSQNTNTKLHRLASDLVGTAQGGPLPKAIREQLAAVVAKTEATAATPDSTS
jgi:hypothetical protein